MTYLNIDRIEWEDAWQSLVMMIVICLAILIGLFVFADRKIRSYYLTSTSGVLKIVPDIDWTEDSSYGVYLDRNITYDDALILLNKMNAGLNK